MITRCFFFMRDGCGVTHRGHFDIYTEQELDISEATEILLEIDNANYAYEFQKKYGDDVWQAITDVDCKCDAGIADKAVVRVKILVK